MVLALYDRDGLGEAALINPGPSARRRYPAGGTSLLLEAKTLTQAIGGAFEAPFGAQAEGQRRGEAPRRISCEESQCRLDGKARLDWVKAAPAREGYRRTDSDGCGLRRPKNERTKFRLRYSAVWARTVSCEQATGSPGFLVAVALVGGQLVNHFTNEPAWAGFAAIR